MQPKTTNSQTRNQPLIVSIEPAGFQKKHPAFPRVMWADYDPTYGKNERVAIYPTKSEQRGNRPDLKPIRVMVVALDDAGQSAIQDAIEVLNRCAEHGCKLADNPARKFDARLAKRKPAPVNPWRIKKFKNWQALQDWLAVHGHDYHWRQTFVDNATALEIRKLKVI